MKNKIIVNINKTSDIESFKKIGVSIFLFALKDYSVGYPCTFSLEEISNIAEPNKYVLINRLLDCESTSKIKKLLSKHVDIKGIFYEDIAVYQIVKSLNLDIELIYFQNHFNSNLKSVNFWLEKVDSVVICNELTKDEIKYICDNAKKSVVLQVYGYNQVMYSRRLLLTNYAKEFNLENKNNNILVENVTKLPFRAIENEYGTVLYSPNIFNGLELTSFNNVKFFYVNTNFINHEDLLLVLSGKKTIGDSGFLNKETIYKLKGDK